MSDAVADNYKAMTLALFAYEVSLGEAGTEPRRAVYALRCELARIEHARAGRAEEGRDHGE